MIQFKYKDWLENTPLFETFCDGLNNAFNDEIKCKDFFGWTAVYIVYLSASTYFVLLFIITIGIKVIIDRLHQPIE